MAHIGIVGMGWLGLPLAEQLVAAGHTVSGTVSSPEKAERLRQQGLDCYSWRADDGVADLPDSLFAPCLIVLLPPSKCQDYPSTVAAIASRARRQNGQYLLFISSTSVYGPDDQGRGELLPHPVTERGLRMLAAEQQVRLHGPDRWLILRLAGLIGPGRHPGRFIRSDGGDGAAPVNLLHQTDALGILQACLHQQPAGLALNACSPSHPSRRLFYTLASHALGGEAPVFSDEPQGRSLEMDGEAVTSVLDYHYQVADLLSWLHSTDIE